MSTKGLWHYIRSKEFWNQVKVMLAIFFAFIFASSILLHCYTRQNSYVEVPNFNKLTLRQSLELAEDNNLRIEVIDSVFSLDLLPGTVVEQDPKAGTKVKKNRRILLIVNATMPQKVSLPNIEGVSLRQAVAMLEADGLMVGKISYSPDIATHIVLACKWKGKKIRPGDMIYKGSFVDLTLGNAGSLKNVIVPDLKGLTLREARKQLTLSYLNTGKVYYAKTVENALDSLNSIVFKQKPAAAENSTLPMGSSVDLWLTVNKDKDAQ
ncbi:MAG: PASTA domain-containing protein [Bacteroidales bacterium]|nr:PASTA domain-containing protein [Bacteroidales bacterium]